MHGAIVAAIRPGSTSGRVRTRLAFVACNIFGNMSFPPRALGALICLTLFASGCERDPDRLQKRAALPFGDVNTPSAGIVEFRTSGPLLFLGWALSDDGIAEVNIYVDRRYVRSTAQLMRSPDVAAVFPGFRGAGIAGFGIELAPSDVGPGRHEVVVQARSNRGAVRDLKRYEVIVPSR